MIFTEIGHFYTNQEFQSGDLNYLKNLDISGNRNCLFIDNFFFPRAELNIQAVKEEAENILQKPVEIFFEGDMVQYYNQSLAMLDIRFLKTVTERGTTWLYFKENRIAQLFPIFRPTCLMLSFTWSLFRLFQEGSILTIIEKKYKKLEENVFFMLPENLKSKSHYIFI